jgi:hypothetical protein
MYRKVKGRLKKNKEQFFLNKGSIGTEERDDIGIHNIRGKKEESRG